MIRYAQARYGPDRFGVGDIEQIAFPDNSFDAVVCLGVLGYLDRDERALREIWRILKPGGRAVIDTGGAICPPSQVDRMLAGLEDAARPRRALILTFHRFSENGQSEVGRSPIRRFAEYMEYLTRHYRVVSLSDMVEELQRGTLRPYTTAVTIDDGYYEAFSLAAPVLRKYGVPATFFVVSDFADGRLW